LSILAYIYRIKQHNSFYFHLSCVDSIKGALHLHGQFSFSTCDWLVVNSKTVKVATTLIWKVHKSYRPTLFFMYLGKATK